MKKTGFGLLETSLILMIVAFMTISALSLYNLSERNISKKASKLKENNYLHNIERLSTRSRLNKIYEEIKYFVLLHHRLPCPANNNSGNEDDKPGSCNNSSTFLTNNNIVYGTLPYNSLNLTNEIVKDKFNNELVKMLGLNAFFYFKDGTVLEINSDKGIYNNKTLDIKFEKNVQAYYQESVLFADMAEYSNSKNFLKVSNKVIIKDTKGEIFADKLFFDLKKQTLDIKSSLDNKINANLNLNEKKF